MSKIVGKVTIEEKNEIQTLFERRNGLNELAKILNADDAELYEKLVKDLGETGSRFQSWWDRMAVKYKWESNHPEIIDNTGKVVLPQNETTVKFFISFGIAISIYFNNVGAKLVKSPLFSFIFLSIITKGTGLSVFFVMILFCLSIMVSALP